MMKGWIVLIVLVITACSDSTRTMQTESDAAVAVDASPPDARDPRAEVATAYCHYLARCFAADFANSYGTEAHCDEVMPMYLQQPAPAIGTTSTCAADFNAQACSGGIVVPSSCAPFGFAP